jgi:chorismate mutase
LQAITGSITIAADEPELIRSATAELLTRLLREHSLSVDSIVSAIFTVTPDLRSEFPAHAAREMGWTAVPLLCATEPHAATDAVERRITVMLHVQ